MTRTRSSEPRRGALWAGSVRSHVRALAAVWLLAAVSALAQQPPTTDTVAASSSVSGVVKDAGTGQPLADYIVSTNIVVRSMGGPPAGPPRTVKATTDAQGQYALHDLPPGSYGIRAGPPDGPFRGVTRHIALAGANLNNLDFNIVVDAKISGKVLDENREPVPGLMVHLVTREYYMGSLGYYFDGPSARADDRGRYTLRGVVAGKPYLLLVEQRTLNLKPYSEVPLNSKLRRPVPMRTWYPNSPTKEDATAIVLRPGEVREGVDFEIRKSPNYCMEGTVLGPQGARSHLSIEPLTPSSGTANGGGAYISAPSLSTAADGKFRVCDLYPGAYRLEAAEFGSGQAPVLGETTVTVSDRDLAGVTVTASTGATLEGEVVLDGPAPQTPVNARFNLSLQPLFRTQFDGEKAAADGDVPGTFSIPNVLFDWYRLAVGAGGPGYYIKDVTYGPLHLLHEPLQFGSAMGNTGLHITIGQDGAKLNVRVTDKDGNPAPDMNVAAFPADVVSEALLQASMAGSSLFTMISRQTDYAGTVVYPTLAPGDYYVFASPDAFDSTVASIDKLWRSTNRFTKVTLPPNGTAQVTLTPITLQ